MEKNIIHDMIRDLEKEFCSIHDMDEINEWKSFKNNWYYRNLNRYQYEVEIYICNNLKSYLQVKAEELSLSDEEILCIFKYVNNSKFRKGLFIGEGNFLPERFNDYKYIEYCLNKGDFLTIGHILSNVDNALDIYKCIQSDWRSKTIKTSDFKVIINQMRNSKNKEVFDLVFDQLCLQDAEFGYSIIEILKNNVKELDANNIISIVKSIYIGGNTIRILDKEYKRSSVILDLIKNIKIENVSTEFVNELLEVISLDDNGEVVYGIINNLSEEEKENIRFYLPKTNIKKV